MSQAIDLAIAAMLAQHAQEQVARESNDPPVVVVRNGEKPAAKKPITVQKRSAPIHDANQGKSTTPGLAMPDRHSLDASGFMVAIRDAGKRPFEVRNEVTGEIRIVVKVDPSQVRNDQIKAIHAFVGYDAKGDFGAQDAAARAQAMRILRGFKVVGPSLAEEKAAARSAAGFVAGMPNASARKLLDLQAQELVVADALIGYVKGARDHSRPLFDRKLAIGLARAERERLSAIRAEIQAMGF